MLQQIEDDRNRFRVFDQVGPIDAQPFQISGDAALPYALGDGGALSLQLTGRVVAVERSPRRVGKANHYIGFALTQGPSHAGQCPAGSNRADESIDLAVGLAPDLRTCGAVVTVSVRNIVELVGPDGAIRFALRQLFGKPPRYMDVVLRIFVRHRGHLTKLGADQP